ncbi:NADH-ubiquinone oxidoreductase-F iron-sulfur binding region domain-containing protein [Halomonas litopenaei]|uniref:NADH-ubiquinone oxidoreductase-F iron-sulfur binding region domain-containing protein n=1 Tax=Halomonas litopenaei TaxID=2109328 RepID=UPI001A8F1F3F|nr:NADH-ubiquinone oxidoreductase-F iron-sulfur binding region domain-containing protein [Halomonas litopenaei]MBN8412282.1 NAD(P)H-dependent oxidoreductase subunit E [Halomonas litopenaei]
MTAETVTASPARRTRKTLKGRQTTPSVLEALRHLLGDERQQPLLRQRQLLIEHLHAIQDANGYLALEWLRALASYMSLPMAAVYETATFYAHFDVVHDDEPAPAALTVRVCDSLSCQLAGSQRLADALADGLDPAQVRVTRAPCMGRCDQSPVVEVGHHHLGHASVEAVEVLLDTGRTHPEAVVWQTLASYQQEGGYELLKGCLSGQVDFEDLATLLERSGLRGLGGAGFPTHRKWRTVREQPGPRWCAVNADEGEPGTFKDRYYLERAPHQMLEGALVACWAVQAEGVYIYLRDEYPGAHRVLREAIAELEDQGLINPGQVILRRGAGAYICGEESAMIESLEGKPGKPRHRPPLVAQQGLFGRPTLVNNVETLYWIPVLWREGAALYAREGRRQRSGLRSFSLSGRVRRPGVYLAPAGISLNELIEEFGGGMADGHRLAGYLPGGASGGILPASKADLPLDFDTLQAEGCFIGSAAIIVLSDQDDLRAVAVNLLAFFADESCGQCTPCRVGSEKMLSLLERKHWVVEDLQRLSRIMQDASICGLGQAAPNPVLSLLRHFRDDLSRHDIIVSDAAEGATS